MNTVRDVCHSHSCQVIVTQLATHIDASLLPRHSALVLPLHTCQFPLNLALQCQFSFFSIATIVFIVLTTFMSLNSVEPRILEI